MSQKYLLVGYSNLYQLNLYLLESMVSLFSCLLWLIYWRNGVLCLVEFPTFLIWFLRSLWCRLTGFSILYISHKLVIQDIKSVSILWARFFLKWWCILPTAFIRRQLVSGCPTFNNAKVEQGFSGVSLTHTLWNSTSTFHLIKLAPIDGFCLDPLFH